MPRPAGSPRISEPPPSPSPPGPRIIGSGAPAPCVRAAASGGRDRLGSVPVRRRGRRRAADSGGASRGTGRGKRRSSAARRGLGCPAAQVDAAGRGHLCRGQNRPSRTGVEAPREREGFAEAGRCGHRVPRRRTAAPRAGPWQTVGPLGVGAGSRGRWRLAVCGAVGPSGVLCPAGVGRKGSVRACRACGAAGPQVRRCDLWVWVCWERGRLECGCGQWGLVRARRVRGRGSAGRGLWV